jgi:hypothetical protein
MTKDKDKLYQKVLEIELIVPASEFTGIHTYSTMFMPPPFDIFIDNNIANVMVNCYLDDSQLKHLFRKPLFFLIKIPDINKTFLQIERYLRDNKNFSYTYPVGKTAKGEYLFMYVFECPEKYGADYDKFLDSKYSETSAEFKSLFHKSIPVQGKTVENPVYGVLHKTPSIKETVERILSCYHLRSMILRSFRNTCILFRFPNQNNYHAIQVTEKESLISSIRQTVLN